MKIQGEAMWASVLSPNTTFEPMWQTDLIITDEQAKAVEKLGLKVKKKDVGNVVTFKRKVNRADGGENDAPVVVDANKEPFKQLIGNGSKIIVQFHVYEWSNKFGTGKGADLQGVQVIEHVEVEGARPPDGAEFEPVDGEGDDDVIMPDAEPEAKPAPKGKGKAAKSAPPADDGFDDDLPDVL